MRFRTACQNHQAGKSAVKCFSQGHNRIAQVVFEPKLCRLQPWGYNHPITLLSNSCLNSIKEILSRIRSVINFLIKPEKCVAISK